MEPGPKSPHPASLALQKGQEIRVDRLGLGRGHAMRKPFVGFQRRILDQLRGQWPGIGIRHDLIVVPHLGCRGSKPSRQALSDQWSNLSGDVLNISACVNRAMSLQKYFVAAGTIGCSESDAP